MILDRNEQKKDLEKMTRLLQSPNDICSSFRNLNLGSLKTSENNNFPRACNEENEINQGCNDVNEIGKKIKNLKIIDENLSPNCQKRRDADAKQLRQVPCNIVCESFQDEIPEGFENVSNKDDEENKQTIAADCAEEKCNQNEDRQNITPESSNLKEAKEVQHVEGSDSCNKLCEESAKTEEKNKTLCSRGPFPVQKSFHHHYQPYENKTYSTYSRSVLQSGGILQIVEPAEQVTIPNLSSQTWNNDIVNFNITQEEVEHVTPPTQTSSLLVENDSDILDPTLANELLELMDNYPVLGEVIENFQSTENKCNNDSQNVYAISQDIKWNDLPQKGTGNDLSQEAMWKDEGFPSSPSCSDRSPIGSPYDNLQRPPPLTSDEDSGSEEPTRQRKANYIDNVPSVYPHYTEMMLPKISGNPRMTEVRKVVRILPKPDLSTAKARLQTILNKELRLRAWAKMQAMEENEFIAQDTDGDTQLMIVVCNKREGQLELLYAMVERMRKIPESLNKHNKAGHSALYLACKLLPDQPLVAAYIAEALLEQNVQIANLKYECNLSLPEILQNEGETHRGVLKELLAVKDSNGTCAFPSYL